MGRVSRRCFLSTRAASWLVGGLAVAMAWLTWMPAMQVVHFGAAVLLLWLLPAVGWFLVLPGGFLLRLVSGLGLAFVGSGLATLMLYLFPGPFPGVIARFVYFAIAVAPLVTGWRLRRPKGNRERKRPTRHYLALILVLGVAILTRFLNIGYSEFQGDEAVVMRRAAEALSGNDTTLFLHQKGPVEILVPMSLWTLTGTITEWQARFPFALAGVLAALTVACLSEMWFGWRAGMASGFLTAINGFLVAFGRIVQYQNLVVAMGGLSLLWLLYHRRHRGAGQLVLAAVFLAFGLLAHYDAVLVGPAALTILVAGMAKGDRTERKRYIYALLLALISGVVILGLFYVPFVSNSMFARTFNYLRGGRLGNGVFHNSLWTSWRMSTFYNSLYYVLGLLVLVVAAAMLRLGTGDAWLYFLIPFVFYSFVVADPRTHIYTWYPGAVVLAGGALLRLHGHVLRRWGTIPLWFAGVWLVLCTGYVYVAFINHQVEYKRAWPESRHPLYPVPFADDQLPPYGFFGFPYQAGWKAVEGLFAQGVLDGTYASNEEP